MRLLIHRFKELVLGVCELVKFIFLAIKQEAGTFVTTMMFIFSLLALVMFIAAIVHYTWAITGLP